MAVNAISGSSVQIIAADDMEYRSAASNPLRTSEVSRSGIINTDTRDSVELSPEARALSRLNTPPAPPPAGDTAEIREGGVTPVIVGITASIPNAGAKGPDETMTPPPTAGNRTESPSAGDMETDSTPLTASVTNVLNDRLEAGQTAISGANAPKEPEPAAPEPGNISNVSEPAITQPPVQTTEGAVVREPITPTARETTLQEGPSQISIQTEELTRINELLNISNGAAASNGWNAVNANASNPIAPEAPRNEQQILLQTVGSQLAQVLPPSRIISVLG